MSSPSAEWLEADGEGGFASGTVSGERTRRYHALLLTAATPPTGRMVLVDGLEVWAETDAGDFALSSQRYDSASGDVVHPDGASRIAAFDSEPWPAWRFRVPTLTHGDCIVVQEIFAAGTTTVVRWFLDGASASVRLRVRPLLSGRDYHSLHHENPAFGFTPERRATGHWIWRPYRGVPPVSIRCNGSYEHAPEWYRNFAMTAERERGLDWKHDLASPGVFRFELANAAAAEMSLHAGTDAPAPAAVLRDLEIARRAAFRDPIDRAADAYFVRRGSGLTIVAGYPWFTDWGRDSFIALRGLALATGRFDDALAILVEWAGAVSEGMLPNRFADRGETAEFNSVDASLWFVVVAGELLELARIRSGLAITAVDEQKIRGAIAAIVTSYARGTRYGIRADSDGLLACGVRGVQLTWMDAKVGDWVVTPRIGKPVEVQALWLNALAAAADIVPEAAALLKKGTASFRTKFWNAERSCLYDVVDCDHVAGRVDASMRPNQILAVGGLPLVLLGRDRARAVVDAVERELVTPVGLRSLSPNDPGYRAHYRGGVVERDGAYHQGTVWPWLIGPFVEAWVRARGSNDTARREARERFLPPLRELMHAAGLGHLSEVADGEAPHAPGGCPFQAWSLAEFIRLERDVLARPDDIQADRNFEGAAASVL
ncbi:MAG TPA: amylo-alpha-1,6-glucosidase [Candidatus Limnocylindrales bacterium]|nr:amylo-alpha-1,6-glucosidase [Candidatus Limnocylindrales bacterium]